MRAVGETLLGCFVIILGLIVAVGAVWGLAEITARWGVWGFLGVVALGLIVGWLVSKRPRGPRT